MMELSTRRKMITAGVAFFAVAVLLVELYPIVITLLERIQA